jgi:hypothetical protein
MLAFLQVAYTCLPNLFSPLTHSVLCNVLYFLQEMGLAFDEWDLDYYTKLFK